jgi:methionyl-tRNA formyltransferase
VGQPVATLSLRLFVVSSAFVHRLLGSESDARAAQSSIHCFSSLMRIAFAGTPTFAAIILAELLRRSFDVVSVLTQPDSLSGRGLKSGHSPVKQLALERSIAVHQPASLKDPTAVQIVDRLQIDVLVVVAYGLILPATMLSLPRLGCLNVHASLLPRWRGAAPIQRAIMAGDAETGVCIMQMDAGLDTGAVYDRRRTPIGSDDTFGSLHDRLAALGAEVLCTVLPELMDGRARANPQPEEGVTYAAKILKPDTQVDWNGPAVHTERLLRALDPSPGATTTFQGQPMKLWRGWVLPASGSMVPPGTVLVGSPEGIDIQCGEGVLRVTELQRAGGRRMRTVDFLRGSKLSPGDRFGA